jgi:hypothetical protein
MHHMKTSFSSIDREISEEVLPQSSPKVCMHVLGTSRTDVRVMREATALVEAGYAVSIVDIEEHSSRTIEEDMRGVHLSHILVAREFMTTRFNRWALFRAAQLLLRCTLRLIQTPTDIYHAHDVSGLLPCYIAARLRGKLLVFDSHELPLSEVGKRKRWVDTLLNALLSHIVPRCAGTDNPQALLWSKCLSST